MSGALTKKYEQRINELRSELASGQEQLRAIEARRSQLQDTMTRIGGAIQVLEELLSEERAQKDS